ncbi:MAG: S9 family peptidase [Candidatus Neomarinimicrobiota bacterium]
MHLSRIITCTALIICTAFAQEPRKLTVREMVADPGLNSIAYRAKQYRWTPDGKAVLYLEKNIQEQNDLLRVSIDSMQVDTVFKYRQLKWIEGERTTQLDPASYIMAPKGIYFMFTGGNDLFLVKSRDTAIVRLTTDGIAKSQFKFSPDAKWISYVRDHNLWIINCETKNTIQLTTDGSESLLYGEPDWVYAEEFDLQQAYQWSPDSRMIAFLQINENGVSRYPLVDWSLTNPEVKWQYYPNAGEKIPEAKAYVVDISTKKVVWLERPQPKNEYIVRIDWLGDTSLVAIQSINRLQNYKKLSYGNPTTGEIKLILEQKDPYWLNVTDLYYFLKKSRNFIYYSENDGYMHLYLYDFSGKLIKQITQGNWMVTDLNGVNERDSLVYFTATKKSVLERHVYGINLNSGITTQIDSGDGEHSAIFSPVFDYYLDLYSNIDYPTRISINAVDGRPIKELYRNTGFSHAKYNFGVTRFVDIPAMDGEILHASILYPSDFDAQKKYPVMVYVYSGPGVQTVVNRFGGVFPQLLAQQGYLVFRVDNRGSLGRGRNWERRIYLQLGKLELQDQLDGVKYLKSLPYVDPNRIGIWGASYGGYLTLYALGKAADVFKTGVAVAPVSHWKYYDAIYSERYMGLPKDHQTEYKESSPINYIDQIKGNFLLIHGTYDDNVHLQQSMVLINELIKKDKHFEMMTYPGRKHGVSDTEGQIHMYEMFLEFIRRNL